MCSDDQSADLAHLVGVIAEIKHPFNSRYMFPSKVGGRPAWLIPSSIAEIKCDSCSNQMTFLLQLYAPETDRPQAFHRTVMVFVCLKCRCFLKCLRAQLQLQNEYYGAEMVSPKDVPLEDSVLDNLCCDSCGMLLHEGRGCRPLPEYSLDIEEVDEVELDVEEEEDISDDDMSEENDIEGIQVNESIATISDMAIDSSEMDLFNEFTETQIEKDKSFRLFKRFVQDAPSNHVIYYSCGGSPLWITDENQMPGEPPACEHCGARRQFEFQIQPQLIFHLMKRLRGFPMDAAPFEWGIVSIFTCSSSCSKPDQPYVEEFVYNQLEPSEWLEFGARKKVDFTQEKAKKIAPVVHEGGDDEWI